MRIAVTGGCGFIGSHVVDHLLHGLVMTCQCWTSARAGAIRPLAYRQADLFEAGALAATVAGADAVFHLAGAADVNDVAADPVRAVRLNVEGTPASWRPPGRPASAGSCWPAPCGCTGPRSAGAS